MLAEPAGAPAALGPYRQGVLVEGGRTLYIAGQIPIEPQTGNVMGEGDIRIRPERVLDNIGASLQEARMGFQFNNCFSNGSSSMGNYNFHSSFL